MNIVVADLQKGIVHGHPYTIVPCSRPDIDYIKWLWGNELKALDLWCKETFGERGEPYMIDKLPHRWYKQDDKFWFRDSEDASMFLLRWA